MTVTVIAVFKLTLARSKMYLCNSYWVMTDWKWNSVKLHLKLKWQVSWNLKKTIYWQNTAAYRFVCSLLGCIFIEKPLYLVLLTIGLCCCYWFKHFNSLLCLAGWIVCNCLRKNELTARESLGLEKVLFTSMFLNGVTSHQLSWTDGQRVTTICLQWILHTATCPVQLSRLQNYAPTVNESVTRQELDDNDHRTMHREEENYRRTAKEQCNCYTNRWKIYHVQTLQLQLKLKEFGTALKSHSDGTFTLRANRRVSASMWTGL